MRRAFTSTLALLLAAGIGFAGPALAKPEPVAGPWMQTADTTDPVDGRAWPGGNQDRNERGRHDPMTGGAMATLTAVRAGAMSSSPPPTTAGLVLAATADRSIERNPSCNTP